MKIEYAFLSFIILILLSVFVYVQNYALQKTAYKISFKKLPKDFEGYKILHLTDIHRKSFGFKQRKLISLIERENPDIVVVSGDIIYCYNHWYNFGYSYKKDLSKVIALFDVIAKKYPVYYSPGNHECKSGYYNEIKKALLKSGVVVLENEIREISHNTDKIFLIGLKDPTFWGGSNVVVEDYISKTEKELIKLKEKANDSFTVLISHRPEIYKIYENAGVDVAFTGHAHGGQWIFPIVGSVFAPQQGFFPKYTKGVHEFSDTKVVISRGMGNSSMPIRLFNRPEVVVVTLHTEDK